MFFLRLADSNAARMVTHRIGLSFVAVGGAIYVELPRSGDTATIPPDLRRMEGTAMVNLAALNGVSKRDLFLNASRRSSSPYSHINDNAGTERCMCLAETGMVVSHNGNGAYNVVEANTEMHNHVVSARVLRYTMKRKDVPEWARPIVKAHFAPKPEAPKRRGKHKDEEARERARRKHERLAEQGKATRGESGNGRGRRKNRS